MKKYISLFLAAVSSVAAFAWNATVDYINPSTVRIIYTPDGFKGKPSEIPFNLLENLRDSSKPQIMNANGVSTTVSPDGLIATMRGNDILLSAGGETTVSIPGAPEITGGMLTLKMKVTGSGAMYGGGERGYSLNLRGDTLVSYNRQNYGYTGNDPRIKQMGITMPMFVSEDGYAIIFDDFAPSKFVLGSPEAGESTLVYSTEATETPLSFVYIAPKNKEFKNLVNTAVATMGKQKMPPLWALGYITSKYGYRTQAETEGVIDTLRREGYPVDGIVLDLYWYGKEQDMGSLSWEKNQWPNHRKMLKNLIKKGVKLIPISQPYVLRNGRGIDNYNFLAQNGMLAKDSVGAGPQEVTIWVGEGGILDVSNPDTRAWLRNTYKNLTDEGVTGWWGDLGEPEVHPETALHANGLHARAYHNKYGNDWSSIIDELYQSEYPETRLMTLMRGGTIGLQKYNVFPWSTDVSRSWGGLEPQIRIMLNSGMSGLGYMSHDVGGFAIDPENPVDPELYVRWLQLGTFSPVLRTHAQQVAEPYKYPEQQDIILPLIKERYRWLPYNYTIAAENAANGTPLVRSLKFIDSDIKNEPVDEYLWGNDVLVAPVLKQGATSREVYFPAGTTWIDAENPQKTYKGGQTALVDAPLEKLPLFIHAGAVIPTADYAMKNTDAYRTDRYTLNVYPLEGEKSYQTTLYEDNLRTPTDGISGSNLFTFIQSAKDNGITLRIEITRANYIKADQKILSVRFLDIDEPASVEYGGKKIKKYNYDKQSRTLTFNINFEFEFAGTASKINLTF